MRKRVKCYIEGEVSNKGEKEMSLKKFLLSLVTVAIFAVFVTVQGVTYAKNTTSQVYMSAIALMTKSKPEMGYSIFKPGEDNSGRIWNIVKYASNTAINYEDANIYCLKEGQGFTSR